MRNVIEGTGNELFSLAGGEDPEVHKEGCSPLKATGHTEQASCGNTVSALAPVTKIH